MSYDVGYVYRLFVRDERVRGGAENAPCSTYYCTPCSTYYCYKVCTAITAVLRCVPVPATFVLLSTTARSSISTAPRTRSFVARSIMLSRSHVWLCLTVITLRAVPLYSQRGASLCTVPHKVRRLFFSLPPRYTSCRDGWTHSCCFS